MNKPVILRREDTEGAVDSQRLREDADHSPSARLRMTVTSIVFFAVYGCATTQPTPMVPPPLALHGVASWYGQEFAGRTTANGEIFDPLLFTAAHRTLPFGTVVDVTNSQTGQIVRVRINDRGPFVGNRMIDLSYAAAQQIGLIDPGSGEVDVKVVSVGRGDREPPAAYTVTIPQPADVKISANEPPKVEFPLPSQVTTIVDNVQVIEKHGDTYTRRTVAPDGKTIESVRRHVKTTAAPTSKRKTQSRSLRSRRSPIRGSHSVRSTRRNLCESFPHPLSPDRLRPSLCGDARPRCRVRVRRRRRDRTSCSRRGPGKTAAARERRKNLA